MKEAIIVFKKNPELGKVKTRLAKGIGEELALQVYVSLLKRTANFLKKTTAEIFVYYSDNISENDEFDWGNCNKFVQSGVSLGDKMNNAFSEVFALGYHKVIIIGTDCYDLDYSYIKEAFQSLEKNQVVIGPALDGGYYLLGMNQLYQSLFQNKSWSQGNLLEETTEDLKINGINYQLIASLSDIDHASDLPVNWQTTLLSK